MATVKIPFRDSPSFTQSITLNGVEYILRFDWNTRGAFWSMSIYDNTETLILAGIRMVIGWPLLDSHTAITNIPDGQFVVYDSNPLTHLQEPGRYDFVSGRNLELLFIEGE